ncbi:sulfur carrier protein ThiS [Neobacillus sp. SM06]|uniref:sulfur carrier protein ThiS n=1 Tax=Neobacillus sp. SM06 TaxID=3422492 RepID=UPI003D27948F
MEVTLNGEQVYLPKQIMFVTDLLEFYNVQNKVVVVEVNGTILNKDEHQETRLSDRDKIEIVHFVGGG